MRAIAFALVLAVFALAHSAAFADILEEAFEKSLESQADRVGDAISAYMASAAAHAEFSKAIGEARRAYFADTSNTRAKAEFEKQLRLKDLYFLVLMLGTEVSKSQLDYYNKAIALQGGLDGGIDPTLFEPYVQWATSVERYLHARHGASALVRMSPAQFEEGLKANELAYASYRKARDAFETHRDALAKKVETLRRDIAQTRENLHLQESHRYLKAPQFMRDSLEAEALKPLVEELDSGALRTLWCEYGPTGVHDDGHQVFETYLFWQDRAPAHLARHQAATYQYLQEGLQNSAALSSCPPSRTQAKTSSPVNRKPVYDATVYAAERKKVATEERARASREQQAQAEQAYEQAREERSQANQADSLARRRATFAKNCERQQTMVDTRAAELAQVKASGAQAKITAAERKLAQAQAAWNQNCGPNRCDKHRQALADAETKHRDAAAQGVSSQVRPAANRVQSSRKHLEDCLAVMQH